MGCTFISLLYGHIGEDLAPALGPALAPVEALAVALAPVSAVAPVFFL